MDIREMFGDRIVLFDGAMGTQIQLLQPSLAEWDGKVGCSEVLNLTAPSKIRKIHENYLEAGAEVVETNTFGANEIVLAEYGLQHRVVEINREAAQIARQAVAEFSGSKKRYVAGSIGPGTKLVTLGQTDFDTMYRSYRQQAKGLLEGGIDLVIIETCQDLLQIKIALLSVTDEMEKQGRKAPIIVSVTVEATGTLLLGSEIGAVMAALEPFDIDVFGMNCATGPEQMHPYIKRICQYFDGPVICQPNAGLPQNIDGQMVYTLPIVDFVHTLSGFITEEGVRFVGGCCGTTPEFIKALSDRIAHLKIGERTIEKAPSLSSLFSEKKLRQDPAPFFVGERTNTNGSKKFREFVLEDDWSGVVSVAQQQQGTGAHGLDLCIAFTGRNESSDMKEAISRIVRQVDLPIFIDSTDSNVIETALKFIGGRAVINSINLEDGEARTEKICSLAKRFGAAVIALTIDESGMAHDVDKKIAIARRIFDIATKRFGLRSQDLIFDALTFTLASGEKSLADSALNTLEGIRRIKRELPGVYTILGVSNISFGLNPETREVLNSVFLAEAVKAGLDLAIVNVKKIMPLYQMDSADREHCLNLIYNQGGPNSLFSFIKHFDKKSSSLKKKSIVEEDISLEEKIKRYVIDGKSTGLDKLLKLALEKMKPLEIVNELLIPAMKKVGELFGAGEMQLPFVLQSAEVMKFAVDKLQPYMEKTADQSQRSIVLATVRGDVHDIGKNLVDIILTNNGYKVYNLGIKCEVETIIQKALEVRADAIGMSGLLVKSTVVMKENLDEMKRRNVQIPVLLGGAALTRSYVEDVCQPVIEKPVVYCPDAFSGLAAMEKIKLGTLTIMSASPKRGDTHKAFEQTRTALPETQIKINRDIAIPTPPFWGEKIIRDIELARVFVYLNETVLFRGRWGYRRGKLSAEEFDSMIKREALPALEEFKMRCINEKLLVADLVYGYYPCNSEGEQVVIYSPETNREWVRLTFPRQKKSPFQNIADFFLPIESGKRDIIALQVVTVGSRASEESRRLFETNQYKKYLLFHGLSVESAEALAEYWHQRIREELQITEEDSRDINDFVVQKYRGARYSFGYPACPDLAQNRKIFELLRPERIGVTLTEEDQMIPEQTTSAFVVHHPQAKYFTIE